MSSSGGIDFNLAFNYAEMCNDIIRSDLNRILKLEKPEKSTELEIRTLVTNVNAQMRVLDDIRVALTSQISSKDVKKEEPKVFETFSQTVVSLSGELTLFLKQIYEKASVLKISNIKPTTMSIR